MMTKIDDLDSQTTTVSPPTTTLLVARPDNSDKLPLPEKKVPIVDTVAATTIAVLAVVLILTLLIVVRALRKRRRERQGRRMDDIPTISGGVMGAGVTAYNNIQVAGRVTWEPVSQPTPSTSQGDNALSRTDRHSRQCSN